MKKFKAGDSVFVVNQTPTPQAMFADRINGLKNKTLLPVLRVGTKYAYLNRGLGEERFDPKTGESFEPSGTERANGYGFDVYESEEAYNKLMHANAERKRLGERLLDRDWGLKRDLTDEQVTAIHAALDSCERQG